jgi:hypothetical protein
MRTRLDQFAEALALKLAGAIEQVNLPGTHLEYTKLAADSSPAAGSNPAGRLFQQTTTAIAQERPRR